MHRGLGKTVGLLGIVVTLAACSPAPTPPPTDVTVQPPLPPEPTVTYSPSEAQPGQRIAHGEVILDVVDQARRVLHAQHHPHTVVETRRVPGPFPTASHEGDQGLRPLKEGPRGD
jgi:hypothetical protein